MSNIISLGNKIIKHTGARGISSAKINLTLDDVKFYNLQRYDRIECLGFNIDNRRVMLYNKEITQYGSGLGIVLKAEEIRLNKLRVGDMLMNVTLKMIEEKE